MPYTITSAPGSEPVTSTEAKLWLKVDHTADDTLITGLITAARKYAEGRTGLALLTQTVAESWDCFPACRTISLALWPVASVTTVQYIATGATSYTTWNSTNYATDFVSTPARIVRGETVSWPTLASLPNAVKVTYVAGYTAASNENLELVKTAMKLLIAFWYEYREDMQVNETTNPRIRSANALLDMCKIPRF